MARGAGRRHRGTAVRLRPARGRTGRARRRRRAPRPAAGSTSQAGEAHVLGKGSKRRTVPVGAQGAGGAGALAARCASRPAMREQAALFLGRHGTRLTAQAIWQRLKRRSLRGGARDAGAPAHAAPFVRQPPAAIERRPARGAGAAGPREHHDDAGLHAAGLPASREGVRRGAPARASARARRPTAGGPEILRRRLRARGSRRAAARQREDGALAVRRHAGQQRFQPADQTATGPCRPWAPATAPPATCATHSIGRPLKGIRQRATTRGPASATSPGVSGPSSSTPKRYSDRRATLSISRATDSSRPATRSGSSRGRARSNCRRICVHVARCPPAAWRCGT